MDAQEQNLCLFILPELVLDKILTNIHNPSNVSRTCKYLYEIVCDMEKHRCVLHIGAIDAKSPLNIDTDAVFDSIVNSHRRIKEIELRVDDQPYHLNEGQLLRLITIMKQFGVNVTSLKLDGFVLPINFIVELLQPATKLESLSFTGCTVLGSATENATMSLQLPSLKELAIEIDDIPGFLDIVNLIPAGSLNSIRYNDESTEVLAAILTKQYNIKSLILDVRWNADLTALCIDHLQLETFIFGPHEVDDNTDLVKPLKCHSNLKELRFVDNFWLSGSAFQWICNNLKKLEVFEVNWVYSTIERNAFEMLGELKHLRHFRTVDGHYLFSNGFQSSQFKSESLEIFELGTRPAFSCGELLTKMVNSLTHNLPNLTHLQMRFENFSAFCFLLRHCTKIIHLNSYISDADPDRLTDQRYPNIQSLELYLENLNGCKRYQKMNQTMTSIVRAMPNMKNMSLLTPYGLRFDVKSMKEFVKESRSLEYLYVDQFVLHRELSTDDVVETIRCLIDQLKGYRINFSPSTSPEDWNWHQIKDSLSKEFSVRYDCHKRPSFYLYGGEKKFPASYF